MNYTMTEVASFEDFFGRVINTKGTFSEHYDSWRDMRKPREERTEEICLKRNETNFSLQRHVKRCLFLMTAGSKVRLL